MFITELGFPGEALFSLNVLEVTLAVGDYLPIWDKVVQFSFFQRTFLFWQVYGQRVVNTITTERALFYSNSALAFCFMTPAISKVIALCFS